MRSTQPRSRHPRSEFKREAADWLETAKPTFRVVTEAGWTDGVFVLPSGECVPGDADVSVCLSGYLRRYCGWFERRGTIAGWRRIPELARGNSRLTLAIALAFVGPVVDLLGVEPVMAQVFGPAGFGKTSIAAAAASVWDGDAKARFGETWNHAIDFLYPVAAAHHATLLVLDATKVADDSQAVTAKTVADAVTSLDGGRGWGCRTDGGPLLRFKTPVLSTSNLSLDEIGRRDGFEVDDAHRDRMIDVPLPGGVVGAFEDLHGFQTRAEFSAELLRVARANHGLAAREFVAALAGDLARDREEVVGWLRGRRARYLGHVRARDLGASRDLERVHQGFATIFAAARLAIDYGVLPWGFRELGNALVECERAHVDHVSQFVSA